MSARRRLELDFGRTLALAIVVAVLIALGVAWAAPSRAELAAAATRLARVSWWWLALAAVLALAPTAAEAIRVWLVGRMIGVAIAPRTALDAAVANGFFTAITPATGLGEPAVAWVLGRGGVPTDAALLVPFVKFTTSFTFVFAAGALAFALGLGPPGSWLDAGGAIVLGLAAATMAAVLIAARRPARAGAIATRTAGWLRRRRVLAGPRAQAAIARGEGGAHRAIARLATVRGRGAGALLAGHALYFAAYLAPLVVLCAAIAPGSAPDAAPRALTYLCVTFLVPTPGGAGFAEAGAPLFFGDLIGDADAVIVVLAFRLLRFASQVVLGGGYLAARGLWGLRRDTA